MKKKDIKREIYRLRKDRQLLSLPNPTSEVGRGND